MYLFMKSIPRLSPLGSLFALRLSRHSFSSIPSDFTISSSTFQPNFISLTNQVNRNELYRKFYARSSSPQGSPQVGIPRLSRLSVRPISILHETPRVIVAGRSRCNGFGSNQYLLIHRETNTGVFIDASDDWPDDWIAFMKSSRVQPTHIFLTHCHIDNVLSLNAFLRLVESEMMVVETRTREEHRSREPREKGLAMGIMWNPAETPWVNAFPRACERYQRTEEMAFALPLLRRGSCIGSSCGVVQATPHYHGGRDMERWGGMYPSSSRHGFPDLLSSSASSEEDGRPRLGRRRPPSPASSPASSSPPLYPDILLSSATNRSTCFYAMGPHTPLHYIFTPGHSPGHTMLHVARERLLFTGDVLGYQHIGRVDLPWGIGARLGESLLSLESLPDDTVLLPGHGRLTTLGRERRHNRALQVLYTWKKDQPHREMPVGFNTGYL